MRAIHLIPVLVLIACGPAAPPMDAGSTGAASSSGSTTGLSEPTLGTTTSTVGPTTSNATTTGGTTETGTTVAFVFKPDVDGGILPCDFWAQDCPLGQKCVPYAEDGGGAWNALKCVDITGDGAVGDPCTTEGGGVSGIDDCAFGAYCWDVDERGHGTCVAMCSGPQDAPTCPPKSWCAISGEILNLCIPTCDPLLQDCPGDDLCLPAGDDFICVLDASGDEGQTNDPCEYANACDPGLVCLNTANASAACQQDPQGCCQPFCKFPGSPCPNPDQQCLQWYDPMMPIPPGNEDVGVCAIPQ